MAWILYQLQHIRARVRLIMGREKGNPGGGNVNMDRATERERAMGRQRAIRKRQDRAIKERIEEFNKGRMSDVRLSKTQLETALTNADRQLAQQGASVLRFGEEGYERGRGQQITSLIQDRNRELRRFNSFSEAKKRRLRKHIQEFSTSDQRTGEKFQAANNKVNTARGLSNRDKQDVKQIGTAMRPFMSKAKGNTGGNAQLGLMNFINWNAVSAARRGQAAQRDRAGRS